MGYIQNFVSAKRYTFLIGNLDSNTSRLCGDLFATSNRKIKSHVEESQITLLVWPCLKHFQKNIAQLIT